MHLDNGYNRYVCSILFSLNDVMSFKKHLIEPLEERTTNKLEIERVLKTVLSTEDHFHVHEQCQKLHTANSVSVRQSNSVLVTYDTEGLISFKEWLHSRGMEAYISSVLHAYFHLMKSLQLLASVNICHNHICFQSVTVDKWDNPLLSDFMHSIQLTHPNKTLYLTTFFNTYAPTYTERPLELHLISFMVEHNLHSLSATNIEQVIDECNIDSQYKEACLHYYSQYENQTRDCIIAMALQYAHTWDIYALSVMFMRITLGVQRLTNNSQCLQSLERVLQSQLHPIPSKRVQLSLQVTAEEVDNWTKMVLLTLASC